MGLGSAAFDECLDRGWTRRYVEADMVEGRQAGVRATPTIYVNGKEIRGAQAYETYAAEIELALAVGP